MRMIEFLVFLGLVWIIAAVIQDFYNREIANWLNFSLIIFAIAYRLFYSIFSNNYMFLVFGLVGLGIFFVVGHIFYYGRLFAGGDAKLFIALGAVIPFANNFLDNNLIFLVFIISLLFGGTVYSLIYSMILAVKNKKAFSKEFNLLFGKNKSTFFGALVFSGLFVLYVLYTREIIYLIFPVFVLGLFLIYIYAKALEESCMLALVPVKKLTIGDWIVNEITVKGKTIKPYWEGLSEEQVQLLKKHHKGKVLVKQGIPFSPSFLIAFLVIVYIQFFQGGDWGLYSIFLG